MACSRKINRCSYCGACPSRKGATGVAGRKLVLCSVVSQRRRSKGGRENRGHLRLHRSCANLSVFTLLWYGARVALWIPVCGGHASGLLYPFDSTQPPLLFPSAADLAALPPHVWQHTADLPAFCMVVLLNRGRGDCPGSEHGGLHHGGNHCRVDKTAGGLRGDGRGGGGA